MTKKRLLTIDDLVRFCSEQKFTKFSSKETGYKIAVQVPTTFETIEEVDDDHRGMLKIKCRLILEGKNSNGSYSSKEAADAAAPTIKNRPVMAAIHQLDDGTWDFEAHNMTIIENEDGEAEIEYIEKQIGSFSEEEPFWEHDDELDRDYLCAYAYIPEEYTKACDILRDKGGKTRSSVELSIEEMSYHGGKNSYLDLEKYYVSAETLLGSHDDGTEVLEGMKGCAATIVDFSEQNNSVFTQNEVMELLERIDQKLSSINIYNSEGKEETEVDENVIEVNEETVDEEIQVEEAAEEEVTTEEMESAEETPSEEFEAEEKFTKTFELSHDDIRCALYALLSPLEETDQDWYFISNVYDDHFVYEGWFDENHVYDQKYTKDGDNIAFDGDRIHMNKELLTDNELAELNAMRSNYSEIQNKLSQYEAEPEKLEILASEEYSKIKDTEEYKELSQRENYFELTKEELTGKLDNILLNAAKAGTLEFAAKNEEKHSFRPLATDKPKTVGRYGGLFKK